MGTPEDVMAEKYFTPPTLTEEDRQHEKPLSERLPERIFDRIHQDIGEASTCWTELEKAGTFDAEHAARIAFNLCHFIADELVKEE